MNTRKEFLTPVGRIVAGDLYVANDKDGEGKPLLVKNGPNAGQPRSEVYFAIAIPKGPEKHWAETAWGQIIWGVGHASFPNGAAQSPTFSWKITDGDSTVPNTRGVKPCDREGWRGCWVLNLSSGFRPKIVNKDGSQELKEEGFVKPGYFVQVYAFADGNGSTQRPGVYLNHMAVAFQAYGEEIVTRGVDTTSVGFGQGVALPAGAMAAPAAGLPGAPGSALPVPGAPAAIPPVPGAPQAQAAMPPMPGAPVAMPAPVAAVPTPVMPVPMTAAVAAPGTLPPLPVPGFPAAPQAPAAPAARTPDQRMLPAAQGIPFAQYLQSGWTEQTLIQHGMMAAA